MRFAALDFETADHGADSACAVGLVEVEGGRIVNKLHRLVRPPRRHFVFTYIHGITWPQVEREPSFAELWPEFGPIFKRADFVAAHNASFDRGVLAACCAAAGVAEPIAPFLCTVQLARRTWNIRPTKLPNVCAALGIELKHHQALSDAEACARIVLAAVKEGVDVLSPIRREAHPRAPSRL